MALAEIARFDDVYEAELAVAFLAAHGVSAQVADRGLATIDPLLQRAVGGLRVMTEARDGPRARDLLARARAGEFATPDGDDLDGMEPGTRTAGTFTALASLLVGGFPGTSRLRRIRPVHRAGLALVGGLLLLMIGAWVWSYVEMKMFYAEFLAANS